MVELSSHSDAARVPPASLEAHLRVPLGALSPLWFVYAGAASAGAVAWWMTRWMQPVNLESLWGGATAEAPEADMGAPAEVEALMTPEELAAESPTEAAGAVVALAPDPVAPSEPATSAPAASEPAPSAAAEPPAAPVKAAPPAPTRPATRAAKAKSARSASGGQGKAKSRAAPTAD